MDGTTVQDALLRARGGPAGDGVTLTRTTTTTTTTVQENGGEEAYDDDDILEDSFADVKARRKAKGKGRDPREGPGFGTRVAAVEDVDDDDEEQGEEEEGEEEEEEVLEIFSSDEEQEEGDGEYDEGEGAYGDDDGVGRVLYDDDDDRAEEAEDEYFEYEEDQEEEEEEEDEEEDDIPATQSAMNRAGPSSSPIKSKSQPQVYELLDSDDEDALNQITSSSPAPEQNDVEKTNLS